MTEEYKLILTLQHHVYPDHFEFWYLNPDGTIHAVSITPHNVPVKDEGNLSQLQALRQFALMTSGENWHVLGATSPWHGFVEEMNVDNVPETPEFDMDGSRYIEPDQLDTVEHTLALLGKSLIHMRIAQSQAQNAMQMSLTEIARQKTMEADDARLDTASYAYAIAETLNPQDDAEDKEDPHG